MEEIIQGTEEWFNCRLGKITASRITDLMAKTKTGEGAGAKNYRAQLVCERLTGAREESYINAAMQRGTDMEPVARECYEFITGNTVEQIGFIDHATVPMLGCSPDGLLTDGLGMVEIKCPNTSTHIKTLLSGMGEEHLPQIQGYMWITGRQWFDFISYDPRLPDGLQLYVQRVTRDDTYISELSANVLQFLAEVAEMEAKLKEIANGRIR